MIKVRRGIIIGYMFIVEVKVFGFTIYKSEEA